MGNWLKFLKRGKQINKQPTKDNPEKKQEKILDCLERNDFSKIGIDYQLIEDIFYRGVEAGIIQIKPSVNGEVKISITNMEIETFPIIIGRSAVSKYFFYDE